jgi:hypothetical protein
MPDEYIHIGGRASNDFNAVTYEQAGGLTS